MHIHNGGILDKSMLPELSMLPEGVDDNDAHPSCHVRRPPSCRSYRGGGRRQRRSPLMSDVRRPPSCHVRRPIHEHIHMKKRLAFSYIWKTTKFVYKSAHIHLIHEHIHMKIYLSIYLISYMNIYTHIHEHIHIYMKKTYTWTYTHIHARKKNS